MESHTFFDFENSTPHELSFIIFFGLDVDPEDVASRQTAKSGNPMFNPAQYGVGTSSVDLLQDSETAPRALYAERTAASTASDGTVVYYGSNVSLLSDAGNIEQSESLSSAQSFAIDTPRSMDRSSSTASNKVRNCDMLRSLHFE